MAEDSLYDGYTKNDEGVGLFIDWENIKIGLNDKYGLTPDIGELLEAIDRFGQRGVSRAYANWQQHRHLHDDQSMFLMRAVETVQILGRNPHSGRVIKNSADVALAVEAVRLCYTQPDITTFVLVTGDGDLVHLVNELKRNRNRVIIVGVDMSISKVLVEAADEVLTYEIDIEPKRFSAVLEKLKNDPSSRFRDSRSGSSKSKVSSGSKTRNTAKSKTSASSAKSDVNEATATSWILDILKSNPEGLSTSNLGHHLWKKHKFTAKDIDLSLEDIAKKLIGAEQVVQEDNLLKLPTKVSKLNLTQVDDAQHKAWLALENLMDEQEHVTLKVLEKSDDGITVDLSSLDLPNYEAGSIKAFVPKSQLDTKRVESVEDITDSELELRILELDPSANVVSLSRSAVLAAKYVNKAYVSSRDKGKTSAKSTPKPSKKNDVSSVQEGDLITAKVTKLMPYGVFVDTGKDIKGLVHISELSAKEIRHPKQVVSVGDELDLKVLNVDTDKEHIALSLIAAQADNPDAAKAQKEPDTQPVDYTWEEIVEKYPEGLEVEGTISNQTPFGVFVALEPGLSALMHVSELGRKSPSAFRRGTAIKAIVANLDHDKQRFSLRPLGVEKTNKKTADTSNPANIQGNTQDVTSQNLDAIEQFKINTAPEEELLDLDAPDADMDQYEQASSSTKQADPLDIAYSESQDDIDYGQLFQTSTGAGYQSQELSGLTTEEKELHKLIVGVQDEQRSVISLNDLYQEYAQEHGNQGNLQDFKKLIKQGHESGWLKLLRHSEDKGLYVQLNQGNEGNEGKELELA